LRAQVNHLRGRVAELRRFPVRQDSEVGWLADPEAQGQVAEVGLLSSFLLCFFSVGGRVLILDSWTASIGTGGSDGLVEPYGVR
jgi:hypothetical protein